jgi:hypothetical protein
VALSTEEAVNPLEFALAGVLAVPMSSGSLRGVVGRPAPDERWIEAHCRNRDSGSHSPGRPIGRVAIASR